MRGNHRIASANVDVRFIRVWVKRAADWRALVYQKTKIAETPPATRGGFVSPSGGAPVDCRRPWSREIAEDLQKLAVYSFCYVDLAADKMKNVLGSQPSIAIVIDIAEQ